MLPIQAEAQTKHLFTQQMDFKMKQLLFIFTIVLSSYSFTQGNLQFNQVVNYENTALSNSTASSSYGGISFAVVVVPTGKVWKIEHCTFLKSGVVVSSLNEQLLIGNNACFLNGGSVGSTQTPVSNNVFLPLWLGEGTYSVSGIAKGSGYFTAAFSALEFNIIL
jgi:hypothetical protein